MAISYSLSANKITIAGYSSATPCNFDDLYTADKAGTLDLMAATSPALNMVLTTQIKPSDEVALKIDFVLASSGAGVGDTIDITGTDKDDGAQLETLTTEADGTFITTKWFKTITDIDCNGFNAGTLTVVQNQWGVVWKNNNQYRIGCGVSVGDNSTETYFQDKNKQIMFSGNDIIEVRRYAHFTLGHLVSWDSKVTSDGCSLISSSTVNFQTFIQAWNGDVNLYASTVRRVCQRGVLRIKTGQIVGCNFHATGFRLSSIYYYNCNFFYLSGTIASYAFHSSAPVFAENINLWEIDIAFGVGGTGDITIKNAIVKNNRFLVLMTTSCVWANSGSNFYLIDCTADFWCFSWCTPNAAKVYRQHMLNLQVIDKDGNVIAAANAKADYKTGVCFAQENVDASGNLIADKTVTKGFYDVTNGDTLVYQETGFDYEYIDLTVSATGYKTHTERFSISEKMTKEANIIKLERIGPPPGAEEHNV